MKAPRPAMTAVVAVPSPDHDAHDVASLPVAASVAEPAPPPVVATPSSAPPVSAPQPSLDPGAGQGVLRDFRARFAEGDLSGLLGLYSSEVHAEHRQLGQIANDYARLFKDSQQRYIDFSDVHWEKRGERLLGSARYETGHRKLKNLRKHHEIGRAEFEVVLEGDASRFRRFELRQGARS